MSKTEYDERAAKLTDAVRRMDREARTVLLAMLRECEQGARSPEVVVQAFGDYAASRVGPIEPDGLDRRE